LGADVPSQLPKVSMLANDPPDLFHRGEHGLGFPTALR
jgi:hypothetical protein